jgi:hypothetical protein
MSVKDKSLPLPQLAEGKKKDNRLDPGASLGFSHTDTSSVTPARLTKSPGSACSINSTYHASGSLISPSLLAKLSKTSQPDEVEEGFSMCEEVGQFCNYLCKCNTTRLISK